MSDSVTVYLPLNTYVSVSGFTNAAFPQQATVVQEDGSQTVMSGSGEHNTPMKNGAFSIQTPASSSSPAGYKVTVTIESQQGGTWQPSKVISGKISVMYYNTAVVVSEDYQDQDWNDAVVQFVWWTPPELR
ncbi:MAG: fucose-binding lectin II [Proteobacteria bacterium]|nr:fucose-binding lectin II [Pseudomonadota bacterium]